MAISFGDDYDEILSRITDETFSIESKYCLLRYLNRYREGVTKYQLQKAPGTIPRNRKRLNLLLKDLENGGIILTKAELRSNRQSEIVMITELGIKVYAKWDDAFRALHG